MVDAHIHDEGEFSPAEAFLAPFLRVAGAELRRYLGRGFGQPIHVILSDHAIHARRFPPQADEILDLAEPDSGDEESAGDPVARLNERFPWETYAHAIATRIAREHGAPGNAPVGEAAIFLDVETILALASEVKVSDEAMLAKVAAHELSHVFRGHIDLPRAGAATHGWFAEGDAQRDAWQVLTALLTDPERANVSMEARAAQVRLSDEQPAAYRQFSAYSERQSLGKSSTLPQPQRWCLTPPRHVWKLTAHPIVEVPILVTRHEKAAFGDLVFLCDLRDCCGPWVIAEVADAARSPHSSNQSAVQNAIQRQRATSLDTNADPSFKWLQLRQRQDLRAGTAPRDSGSAARLRLQKAPADLQIGRSLTESPNVFVKRRLSEENANWLEANADALKRNPSLSAPDWLND